ncbi:MAG: MFS transporter, partial [Rhodospirillales bacterium]|nr:MFS transporter [Rhodospirillales bacterium]
LVALSQVTQLWQFYVVWFGLGVAMSATLYVACFAVLTHYMAGQAKRAITLVTLVAGLAGTIAFPGVHGLMSFLDWRQAVLVFAAFIFAVAVPTIWSSCKRAETAGEQNVPETSGKSRDVMVVTKTAAFWLLGLVVMAMSLGHGMIITHLLPILDDRGIHPETAILAAAMIGPMQVSGRLAMMAADRHASVLAVAVGSFVALFLGPAALLFAGGSPALVVAFVILQGAGAGVTSIVRPVLTAELLGRRNFGMISGLLAIPYMGGFALAPSVAAVLWTWGGYDLALMLAGTVAGIGMVSVLAAWHWRPARVPGDDN